MAVFALFAELIKIRILFASLLTTCLGYLCYLDLSLWNLQEIGWVCLGAGLVFSAAAAMNHVIEWRVDQKMDRTKHRPIPAQKVTPFFVTFGVIISSILGIYILYYNTPLMVVYVTIATFVLYNFVYTPAKKLTVWNTFIGAFPGALPLLSGWYMVHASLNTMGLLLFLILYMWQLPHFYAIAWINKHSYTQGGLKMISVMDKTGEKTARYLLLSTIIFVFITYCPAFFNLFSYFYVCGMSVANAVLLVAAYRFYQVKNDDHARRVLLTSIVYPPLLLVMVVLEKLVGVS